MKEMQTAKKPIYKKWWFWILVAALLWSIFEPKGNNQENAPATASDTAITSDTVQPAATTTPADAATTDGTKSPSKGEVAGIKFRASDVRNDATGKWKISTIAENINMEDHALEYYQNYFSSDDEIHAIVNFNYRTTTKISVIGNLLDVTVQEYVDGEEHDAKQLFGGTLLKEYHVNKDTGEIEEIQ